MSSSPRPAAKPRAGRSPQPPWPVGLTVTDVRPLTPEELELNGWSPLEGTDPPMGMVLSDGSVVVGSETPHVRRAGRTERDYRYGSLVGIGANGGLFQFAQKPPPGQAGVQAARLNAAALRRLLAVDVGFDMHYFSQVDPQYPRRSRRTVVRQSTDVMVTRVVGGRHGGNTLTLRWADVRLATWRGDDVELADRQGPLCLLTAITKAGEREKPKQQSAALAGRAGRSRKV